MESNKDYSINLDEILDAKFGKKGRVPKFLKWALRKILHVDDLNSFFCKGLEGVEFCRDVLEGLDIKVIMEKDVELDPAGHYTFVSNHPLGALEALAELSYIDAKADGKILCLVNDFLMYVKGLSPFFIPVNKTGSQSRKLSSGVQQTFSHDGQVLIFPAGKVSRKNRDGIIEDQEWSKTFIQKSVETQRDIVPIHFIARNSWRFYAVDKLDAFFRKRGLKFPIAMALLPGEIFRSRGNTFKMRVGEPIPWQTFDDSKTPKEWAQWVRKLTYDI